MDSGENLRGLEPMKPLSKLVKKWRKEADYLWSVGRRADAQRIRECADELEARLREADAWLEPEKVVTAFPSENERSMDVSKFVDRIRCELLGTIAPMQSQVKQEGEK